MRVDRPWGYFVVLYEEESTWLKRLVINAGQSLSLQYHHNRDEYWRAEQSGLTAAIGSGYEQVLIPGVVHEVYAGVPHRITNTTAGPRSVLEWAVGQPDESDIVRLDDDYGRTEKIK